MTTLPTHKKRRFYSRWWFWLIVIVLLLVAGGAAMGGSAYRKAQQEKYDYLNESVAVQKRTIKKTISATGTLIPEHSTTLSTSVPGRIKEVNALEGEEVDSGFVIATIESSTGQKIGEITAPFAGRVISIAAFPGAVVTPGVPVIEFGTKESHVEFYASDAEVIHLVNNQDAFLTVPSYENGKEVFKTRVHNVGIKKQTVATAGAQAVETGYLVSVHADTLPAKLQAIVGLSVDVEILVGERADVLSLEAAAIQYTDEGKPFVYRIPTVDDAFITKANETENITDLLEKKEIEIGFQGDEYIEVTSGLADNENVLLYIPVQQKSLF